MSSSQVSRTPTRRPRVLVLVKGLGIGGAETLIADSARLWDRDSFEYRVAYFLPWKDHLVPALEAQEVDVTCLEWRGPPGLAALNRLKSLTRRWRPDIVHSHLPAAAVMARLTLWNPQHVYTEHNLVHSYRQPTRWLNRATYGRNVALIAVSEAVAETVASYPGPEPDVVPNGVSIRISEDGARRSRAELDIEPDVPLVVHVGNIRPHKGHETLIDAVSLLRAAVPDVVVVSIGGEKHRGDLERLRSRARAKGLDGQLRFLGRRHDARNFIAASDVVVNPADVEGLPVSLLEALALKRPVVATAVGGVPSVVHDRRSGLLVPPGDSAALAKAMEEALTSPDSARWGVEGARIVEERHGLDRMVAAYEDIYRRVLRL